MKYNTITAAVFILIGSFFGYQVQAQQAKTLTLREAIDLSIKNSKQLKVNAARILEATAAVQEANERRLPEAGASATYLYLPVRPTINLKTGSDTSGSASSSNRTPAIHQAMLGMLSASLPLYTGGKLKYGIESAKYLEQAVKLDNDHDSNLVLLNVINACINLYKAYQAIDLVNENLKQSQQRVADLSNLEKNGLLARNDLLKAQLQSSNIELTLADAESNYKLASVNMNIMMGLPEQTVLIPDKSGLALPQSIKTLEEYEAAALQNRKDIEALSFRKKAASTNVDIARSDYYPNIALTGGYVAANIPQFLTITNAVNIGVGVKYDIASLWKTKTKIQQAKLKVQEISANEEMLNDNIRIDINRAYQSYLVGQKKIEVYEKAIEQANENYRITNNKYKNDLATLTEVLDADVAVLQTNLSVTNAKADLFLTYNRLLQAAGILKY